MAYQEFEKAIRVEVLIDNNEFTVSSSKNSTGDFQIIHCEYLSETAKIL